MNELLGKPEGKRRPRHMEKYY